MQHVKAEHLWFLVKITLLAVVYFITASIGLSLDAVSGFAALVWPPTGIALAAILIFGYRYWPGIALAAFLVNFMTGAPPFVALGIATGNTLEVLLGAYVLKRYVHFQNSLERLRDVVGLVFLVAGASTIVSATIGVTSLWLGGVVSSSAYDVTWVAWWVGDMLGALVIAPFILVWSNLRRISIPERFFEALIFAALLLGVSILAFRGLPILGIQPLTFMYLIFPILIWIALRFGQRGSVSATLLVVLIAIWSTAQGSGPFAGERLSESLLLLQNFMGVTAATFMIMAAAVSERERTLKREHQLMQKTSLLTKQRMRLEALNEAKDEFIYVASHQLRTPATVVKQYIGMLLGDHAGKLTTAQHHLLQYAYESNERQIQVINELLGVAQVDAGNVVLEKEKTDLVALVMEVLQVQGSAFAERNQTLTFNHPESKLMAYVDKRKLRMVLENLIDNASKYTLPGKEIGVGISKTKNELTIAVTDEGLGMTKKDIGRLFKKFSRINNPLSVAANGTGLGLYWARKVVELHGGSITVSSKLNEGSTFTVLIPVTKGPS